MHFSKRWPLFLLSTAFLPWFFPSSVFSQPSPASLDQRFCFSLAEREAIPSVMRESERPLVIRFREGLTGKTSGKEDSKEMVSNLSKLSFQFDFSCLREATPLVSLREGKKSRVVTRLRKDLMWNTFSPGRPRFAIPSIFCHRSAVESLLASPKVIRFAREARGDMVLTSFSQDLANYQVSLSPLWERSHWRSTFPSRISFIKTKACAKQDLQCRFSLLALASD